jgi:hypothetical protein
MGVLALEGTAASEVRNVHHRKNEERKNVPRRSTACAMVMILSRVRVKKRKNDSSDASGKHKPGNLWRKRNHNVSSVPMTSVPIIAQAMYIE